MLVLLRVGGPEDSGFCPDLELQCPLLLPPPRGRTLLPPGGGGVKCLVLLMLLSSPRFPCVLFQMGPEVPSHPERQRV